MTTDELEYAALEHIVEVVRIKTGAKPKQLGCCLWDVPHKGPGHSYSPKAMCSDDARIHPPHGCCPGRDHRSCQNITPHGQHGWGGISRPWYCLGVVRDLELPYERLADEERTGD